MARLPPKLYRFVIGYHRPKNLLSNEGNLEASRPGADGRFLRGIFDMEQYDNWSEYSGVHLQLYLDISQGRVKIVLD
jgi:hypothetical protein